jgi:Holliday junction resolvase RusA-like endonuclease
MIEQGFFIPGPLPGLNEMLDARGLGKREGRKRPNRYNDLKREWEALICLEIAKHRIKPVTNPVKLEFYWIEHNRRRDPDNIAAGKKLILDSLVKAGVIPNDSQAWIKGWTDSFTELSKKDPGVCVVIQQSD